MAPPKIERFVSISDVQPLVKKHKDPIERFVSKITFLEDGCWEWGKSRHKDGYGIFSVGYRAMVAHRWSYAYFIGDMDPELVIDHLCKRRSCVNPFHLEQVTNKTNSQRGANQKTHCLRGHPHVEENDYVYRGRRWCKPCRVITLRASRARRKVANSGTT